jgi:hypothetical protein
VMIAPGIVSSKKMCVKFNLVYDVYVYINWFDIFCYDMHAYWIMLFLKVLDLYNRIIRDG